MSTKSLADLQAQIEKLQAEATKLRDEERAGVVARIREAIQTYDLTAQDLFGSASRRAAAKRKRGSRPDRSVAFADGTGNVWGGRGPRPKWLREALKQGKQLADFAVGQQASSDGDDVSAQSTEQTSANKTRVKQRGGRTASRKPGAKAAATSSAKYRDNEGNAWSGMGPKPKWLKDALATGQALESFQVQ